MLEWNGERYHVQRYDENEVPSRSRGVNDTAYVFYGDELVRYMREQGTHVEVVSDRVSVYCKRP